jgi:hypothetical protein
MTTTMRKRGFFPAFSDSHSVLGCQLCSKYAKCYFNFDHVARVIAATVSLCCLKPAGQQHLALLQAQKGSRKEGLMAGYRAQQHTHAPAVCKEISGEKAASRMRQ